MSDLDRLNDAIVGLQGDVKALSGEVGILVSKSHTPQSCPLSSDVKKLQLSEARQAGALAVIGVVATLIASTVATALTKMWGK